MYRKASNTSKNATNKITNDRVKRKYKDYSTISVKLLSLSIFKKSSIEISSSFSESDESVFSLSSPEDIGIRSSSVNAEDETGKNRSLEFMFSLVRDGIAFFSLK